MKMKKLFLKAISTVMILSLSSFSIFAADLAENQTYTASALSSMSVLEKANLSTQAVNPEVKKLILNARADIAFGEDTAWVAEGEGQVIYPDGTVENIPLFSELYPNWDLKEVSDVYAERTQPAEKIEKWRIEEDFQLRPARAIAGWSDNVDLPIQSNQLGKKFYSFTGQGESVYAGAETLPIDTKCNIGYWDEDTGTSAGWKTSMGEEAVFKITASDGVRYNVRVSANKVGTGWFEVQSFKPFE